MKKITTFLLIIFTSLSLYATTTIVYVNPSHVNADDTNDGTNSSAPWMTLNFSKWANNMEIHVSNGEYTVPSPNTRGLTFTNLRVIGESRTGVVFQGMTDADYAANMLCKPLFQIAGGGEVLFSTLTFKNVRDNETNLGGVFDLVGKTQLNLTDITFTNINVAGSGWSGGGAIFIREGVLAVDNCLFDGCKSSKGGAIMAFTNSSMDPNAITITNTKFINNSNPNNGFFANDHFGGAIVFSGKGTMTIDKCYFEGNSSRVNLSNTSGSGGCIEVRIDGGATSTLNVSNSVFYANESDAAASVFSISSNGATASSVFNTNFSNNIFFQNKGSIVNKTNYNTFNLSNTGGSNYTGTFVFANNTFFQNYNALQEQYSTIVLDVMPVDVHFVNNLINDDESGKQTYGFVCYSSANIVGKRHFKGNIFNVLGGSINVNGDQINFPDLYQSNSNSSNGNRSWISNADQKINTSLTTTNDQSYLAVNEGGMGINFGFDEYLVGSVNIVPATDILGKTRVGKTDSGAFEYGNDTPTKLENIVEHYKSKIWYNTNSAALHFEVPASNLSLFDINGKIVLRATYVDSKIELQRLPQGTYFVKALQEGIYQTYKFIK